MKDLFTRRTLHRGLPVREWLQHPDRYVTRSEVWELLKRLDAAQRGARWYRRLWRWLLTPVTPEAPSSPP